jgi:16S rRNA processing protein RimM
VDRDHFILIGKVTRIHGVKGTVKVYSYAESSSFFRSDLSLCIQTPNGLINTYQIAWAKPHKRSILVALKGVDDRDSAQALIGAMLFVDKQMLPHVEEGTYYWFDLIGLAVETDDGDHLGKIESILQTGANDVYVVRKHHAEGGSEVLVPALASVIQQVDLHAKRMRVKLPEGLFDKKGD